MTNREAVDALANYFGVPLNDRELRAHQHAGLPSWIYYHKSQKQACKEYFSLGDLDHPCRCQKNGKTFDHDVLRDAGNDLLRSVGFRVPRKEKWMHEWIKNYK